MVTCLGVLIASELTFMAHVKHFPGHCYYQFVSYIVHRALSVGVTWMVIHAFVVSHVNYCNSICGFTSDVHHRPLKSIINTTARHIVKRRKFDCIADSSRLTKLPANPVQYTYKICLLVYKCLHDTPPSYLADKYVSIIVNPACSSLQSSTNHDLMYPWTHLVRYS